MFVKGRKSVFSTLQEHIKPTDNIIWVHAASLGEYEQGLPIMEKLKESYPDHKLLLTFFSPSGYEIKKNTPAADVVTYLPMDTAHNAKKFLTLAHPQLVVFIKYEIWPNYLILLKQHKIPTLLISALFKKKQIYFKSYGGFMRNVLGAFTHFFVQDESSKNLLSGIGYFNVSITGDTRLDRVMEIVHRDNHLGFMERFKDHECCFVAGSTWPQDEAALLPYINNSNHGIKFVIAPHTIKREAVEALKNAVTQPCILYSELEKFEVTDVKVLIIDTIGLLTKIYSYADIAYVGGGFKTGLHNTLEPAVFGIPVIIGPNYSGFREAEDLVGLGGIISCTTKNEVAETIDELCENPNKRKEIGAINHNYILKNKGASIYIMHYIRNLL